MIRRICLVLIAIAAICFAFPAHIWAESTDRQDSQLVERLAKIAESMQRVHFCYNENCSYRNIETKIEPPATPDGKYSATITAVIDRPSAGLDSGDYHFIFSDSRWQLIKGEEYTDVADYVFDRDRYEIYSVHTNHKFRGDIAQAQNDGNLKSGYLPLYFDVLDRGLERI
jgi:hypothetical protein